MIYILSGLTGLYYIAALRNRGYAGVASRGDFYYTIGGASMNFIKRGVSVEFRPFLL